MSIRDNSVVFNYFLFLTVLISFGIGSFLHCAAYRIARHENFVKGSSYCPKCGHKLAAKDLIPIFSFLLLKGKCRYCKKRISPRYIISEIVFILLMVSNLVCFDITYLSFRNAILLCCLFIIVIVDYEAYEIPNGCILLSILTWVVFEPFCYKEQTRGVLWIDAIEHIGAMIGIVLFILTICFVLKLALKRKAMGFGDIKLLAVMGLYLGVMPSLFGIIFACILGLGFYLFLQKNNGGVKSFYFPFGPALSISFWIMLCTGDKFVTWYYHLFNI